MTGNVEQIVDGCYPKVILYSWSSYPELTKVTIKGEGFKYGIIPTSVYYDQYDHGTPRLKAIINGHEIVRTK